MPVLEDLLILEAEVPVVRDHRVEVVGLPVGGVGAKFCGETKSKGATCFSFIVCLVVAPLLTFLALCCCGAWTTPRGERCVCYPVKYRPCSRRCAAGSGLGLLAAALLFVVLLYFSTGCGSVDLECGDRGRAYAMNQPETKLLTIGHRTSLCKKRR